MMDEEPNAQSGRETFELVLRGVRKHWLAAVLVWGALFASVAFYTVGQRRIFRASAMIQIEPNPPRPLGNSVQAVVDVGNGSYWDNKEYYLTQLEILRGGALSLETARTLGLQADVAFLANLPSGSPPPKGAKPGSLDDAAAAVRGRLSVELIKDSRLVTATLEDANPERARRILSTLLDLYLERNVSTVVASSAVAGEWLHGQTEKLKQELEQTELALHDYKRDKRILSVSLDDQSNMLRGEMQQLNTALTAANAKKEELSARVAELDKVAPEQPDILPADELLTSTILTGLRSEYSKAKADLESAMSSGKGENHPETEALRARVSSTRMSLLAEVKNVQGALHSELAAAAQESKGLSKLLEQAKQRALDLNMLEIEYRRLERAKENTEKLFGLVLERSKESDLTGMMRFNNLTVVEPATATKSPIKPNVPVNLGLGALLGLFLSLGLVVALEWLDRTIRLPEDVEEATGMPLLGLLPAMKGKASNTGRYSRYSRTRRGDQAARPENVPPELIAHAFPESNLAECARGIRTNLTFASPDKPHRSILVTSATPSEGKTTVATTIAITFAQAGQRVLLVDCDLRRARLHRVLGRSRAAGVTSVLQEPETLASAICSTTVPNLSLLPAGPHVANPAEVLQSAAFERLLGSLTAQFDRVVIDSPPVMVVTDAAILSTRVDATVLVFRAKKTTRDVAKHVVRKLAEVGVKVAGVVLNAMEAPRVRGEYYYGYYSRDGYQPTEKPAVS